ncbi:MAG: translation elongation factor Ts [Rhodospirillales bacterium]|jgi:elongation factor Ts|nr:translation elongation factor Ts [Alphaproteobacteria bacterium]MDP6591460.1 translation elongation factor Ts [Alphaproteobacteria bacterium]MDP6843799.1 translation elongation factor Ts [Rhodospirillales bacterium]
MADITAALVKELREKTGVGMMDCKKALGETSGDIEAAVDWLRTQGLAAAAKKAGRVASEGLIGLSAGENSAALVEVNSETDFVSRNEDFQAAVREVAALALGCGGDIDKLRASDYPGKGHSVDAEIVHLVSTIGENINIRRATALSVDGGVVASYIHAATAPELGRIGALVAIRSDGDSAALSQLGHQLAMHVAAANPQAISVQDLDSDDVARERAVLREQAEGSGKPAEIIDKMVDGRLRKYYQEVVLLEQTFVIDGETNVAKVIEQAAKDLGSPVAVTGIRRFALGEGIEREESDFAAEVAAQLE